MLDYGIKYLIVAATLNIGIFNFEIGIKKMASPG